MRMRVHVQTFKLVSLNGGFQGAVIGHDEGHTQRAFCDCKLQSGVCYKFALGAASLRFLQRGVLRIRTRHFCLTSS